MPVISGGGGGGNTTAQVTASGKVHPTANASGVTVDTTTYDDNIKGSGKMTTLIFPVEQSAFAIALAGDLFPRWVMSSDARDYGLLLGDGTYDPTASGGYINVTATGMQIGQGGVAGHGVAVSPGASAANGVPQLQQVSPRFAITSGALPTQQLVSGTGAQLAAPGDGRDVETITPCTFNPGAATTATVTVALSPDNFTYSTLGIETEPAGVAFDGTIHLVKVRVPAGWYLKLTVNAQATLGLTTYY